MKEDEQVATPQHAEGTKCTEHPGEIHKPSVVVCPEAPYPLHGGGPLRTASMIEFLLQRGPVDLILFRAQDASNPCEAIPAWLRGNAKIRNVSVIEIPKHSKHPAFRIARNIRRLGRRTPPLVDRFSGYDEAFSRALASGGVQGYAAGVIEHFWCAPYLQLMQKRCETTVLNLHNVESALYAGYMRTSAWPMAYVYRRFAESSVELEYQWLPRFSQVLVASEADLRRVMEVVPQACLRVYPNAIPRAEKPVRLEEAVVVFSGSFEYPPNQTAVAWFGRDVWPRLHREWPELRFRLIGKQPEAVRRLMPEAESTGAVDDAISELAAAQVVVVPLLNGSGTRLKILEAWAAERAVVSTTVGAEGLPARHGDNILIADSPADFAGAVSELLSSSETRQKIGKAGRETYENGFTWEQAWKALNF